MNDTPEDGLTPPGPAPEGDQRRTGGMSVDEWLATQGRTPRPSPSFASPAPVAQPARTDAGLGWTALGLSIPLCIPCLPLAGLVLAIITLARKRFRPRWVAVVALLLGLAGTGLQVAVVADPDFWDGIQDSLNDSLEDEAEDARRSGEPTEISSLKLRTGDCFDDPIVKGAIGPGAGETSTVTLIPCDQKHDLEVVATFRVPGKDFPGQDAFGEHVRKCFPAFRRYVGKSYGDSSLEIFYYSPTQQSWSLLDDRTITCLAGYPKRKLSESVKGSKR